MPETYVPLRVHSPFSIAEGAIRIDRLAQACADKGIPACAITDTNSLAGVGEMLKYLPAKGVQPIMAVQINLGHGGKQFPIALYAATPQGRTNLVNIVSKAAEMGEVDAPAITVQALSGLTDGLICLSGGIRGPIDQALLDGDIQTAQTRAQSLKRLFGGHFYMEISRLGTAEEAMREKALLDLAEQTQIPLVATNEAWFLTPEMHASHDALLCVADGTVLANPDRRRAPASAWLKGPAEMNELFADLPGVVENSASIAKMCHTMFEMRQPMLPRFPGLKEGETEAQTLREMCQTGLDERLSRGLLAEGQTVENYQERLDYELKVINGMGFPGYFLIVSEFIQWARENNIPVGPGRGSGAGSLVAYSLKITDIDPLRHGLLFERFLNPDRVSMPDFDIDFAQNGRDSVKKHVSELYGQDRVAQIGTFMKMQARAVVRDTGRVMSLPFPVVDQWVRLIPQNPGNPMTLEQCMQSEPLCSELAKTDDSSVHAMFKTALDLEGLFKATSIHAAGVVIASDPIALTAPLQRDKHGELVLQYDGKTTEQAGLVKFDFLGLASLDVIKGAQDILNKRGIFIDFESIDNKDKKTYEMIGRGETFSVFQMEKEGMQNACRQIRPTEIGDLTAIGALYRPGPMDNITQYARVKNGEEKATYLHPLMEPILKETNGIIVYQEQVMEIAKVMAGYTLGQADLLRRAMGKKIKSEMDAQREIFIQGCEKNKIPTKKAEEVFDLLARFADYGFNKSHAAAYGVLTFQTAYLKAHYPEAFYASGMTIDIGNTDKIAAWVRQARLEKLRMLPPDIHKSGATFLLEETKQGLGVRFALSAVNGMGEDASRLLIQEREKSPFKDLNDLVRRGQPLGLNKKMLESLAKAGALDSLGRHRGEVIANVESAVKEAQSAYKAESVGQGNLFGLIDLAPKVRQAPDLTKEERLEYEFKSLGFFLSGHPLDEAQNTLKRMRDYTNIEKILKTESAPRWPVTLGLLVQKIERKSTRERKPMMILHVSDPTGLTELVVFGENNIAKYKPLEIKVGSMLLVKVDIKDQEDGSRKIWIKDIENLPARQIARAEEKMGSKTLLVRKAVSKYER